MPGLRCSHQAADNPSDGRAGSVFDGEFERAVGRLHAVGCRDRDLIGAGLGGPTRDRTGRRVDRHVVIDRRITQGTRSEAGQRYNERMWTAIATCKKQKKSFFEFLLKSSRQSSKTTKLQHSSPKCRERLPGIY